MKNIITIVLLLLAFNGCEQSTEPLVTAPAVVSGNVAFMFDKVNAPASVKTLTTVLSRSGYTAIEKILEITNDTSSSIVFEQVAVGTWKIVIDAKDENGKILYTGQSEVMVMENIVTHVNLVLSLVTSGIGSVQINVTWASTRKILFPKYFGGSNRDASLCVLQTNDGGYILGGITFSKGTGGDAWIVKTSSDGEIKWSKSYGGITEDRINDIVQTEDGGYLFVGYTTGNDEDSWIVKLDSLGNNIWEKKYPGLGQDAFLKIKEGIGGIYWSCGYFSNSNFFEGRITKINSNGDLFWSKTYGGNGGDFAMNILPLQNGEAIVIGNNGSIPGKSYDFWAFKVSDEGTVLWEKNYGGSNDDRVSGICYTADGDFLLSGYTTSYGNGTQDAWIICINDTGKINWSKTIGEYGNDYLLSIKMTNDNNYIATGQTTSYGNNLQGWAVKIDQSGLIKWLKTYGGQGNDVISDHFPTTDGGFVFSGTSRSTSTQSDDFWLGKVNSDGEME